MASKPSNTLEVPTDMAVINLTSMCVKDRFGTGGCESCTDRSDFSDTFEDPEQDTDCDSWTTETSSVYIETESPDLQRDFKHVDVVSESDTRSNTSTVVCLQSSGIISLERTSPDGQSSPEDVESNSNKFVSDDQLESSGYTLNETTTSKDKGCPVSFPSARSLFRQGACGKSAQTVYHVTDSQSSPTSVQELHQSDLSLDKSKLQSNEILSSVHVIDELKGHSKPDNTHLDVCKQNHDGASQHASKLSSVVKHSSNDPLTGVTELEATVEKKYTNICSNDASVQLQTVTCFVATSKDFSHQRSSSMPNIHLCFTTSYQTHLNSHQNHKSSDISKSKKTSDLKGCHSMDLNLGPVFAPYALQNTNIRHGPASPLVCQSDPTASTISVNYQADDRFPRRSRRPGSNVSENAMHLKCYNQKAHHLQEPGPQNMRKHLPNPFNKANHRFHSTLHCPCFIFFCFLCCYPAVYLMQRSDIQFISGDDILARKNGKRASILYIGGAVISVLFMSTLLFVVYYFVGDDLIKTTD